MKAEAFFESEMERLIDFGLANIPESSRLLQCIRFVRSLHAQELSWVEARRHMLEHFGDPDASKAVQNLGITILALLYGGGNFGRTQLIALNCGYDTDCTCATAGAILGIIGGTTGIPEHWKWQAEDTFVVGIDVQRPSDRISDLATDTCRVGVAVACSLNPSTAIVAVPATLGVDRINIDPPAQPVTISVDYLGKPILDPQQPTQVRLELHNRSGQRRGVVCSCPLPAASSALAP
jgi:hypothetical protein